jgi:hypothetical protein
MNSVLENQEHKLFQPLPLRNNIIPKNIILATACIIGLFCPGNLKKSELLKKVKENQFDIWNNLLDLNNISFKKKNNEFNNQISTDGISCSLLFIPEDLKNRKWGSKVTTLPEQEYHNIEDLCVEQLDTLKM